MNKETKKTIQTKNNDPKLKLNNTHIQLVDKSKFLGLILHKKLTLKHHIQSLKADYFKKLNIIKTLAHYEWEAHIDTRITLYKTLVRSKLDYASILYNNANTNL